MAFVAANLTKIANLLGPADLTSPTPGLWFYNAGGDSIATVLGAGYFNSVAGNGGLGVGAIIDVLCSDGRHSLKVSANTGAVVTVVSTSAVDKIASGQHATVAASDTIVTGLGALKAVIVTSDDDPAIAAEWVTGSIGDQAGAPAAGSFLLKSWKPTAVNDATPIAATTFTKKVNWVAFAA